MVALDYKIQGGKMIIKNTQLTDKQKEINAKRILEIIKAKLKK